MSTKTILYLGLLFAALLTLALGGWTVKGAKALTGRTKQPDLRPRFA
jgi:hypothetical protein